MQNIGLQINTDWLKNCSHNGVIDNFYLHKNHGTLTK